MSAVIENLTGHPSREVERLVRFALREQEADDRALAVRVKNSGGGLRGRYYAYARNHTTHLWDDLRYEWRRVEVKLPRGCSHLITVKLPSVYPRGVHYYARSEMPPPDMFASWQEALVWVTAHEAKHHWQHLHRRKRAAGRRRWQFKETECDFAGYRTLRAWRAR